MLNMRLAILNEWRKTTIGGSQEYKYGGRLHLNWVDDKTKSIVNL